MAMFESTRAFCALPFQTIITFLCLATAGGFITLVLYRLWFHPLARYPGPRLAAATGWYETYFDCLRGGRFSKHIDDMHIQYGNIVRINPWELHIRDPAFFDHFYTSSTALEKDPWYYNFAGIPRSTFATSSAVVHRQRRSAIARSFATSAAVSKHIEACVERLLERLESLRKDGPPQSQVVQMSSMFWMLASDIVTGCMMPRATDYMTYPKTAPGYAKMFKTLARVALWNRHFSRLFSLLSSLPRSIVDRSAKPFTEVLRMQDDMLSQIRETDPKSSSPLSSPFLPNLLRHLHHSKLPATDKLPSRLLEEATMILGAGTEAVGAALSLTTYHLLSTPRALTRLKSELRTLTNTLPHNPTPGSQHPILPSPLLHKHCPYLLASIKEGLRLSKESNRMPRINRSFPTLYAEHAIPAGTVISMSLRDVHLHPSVFPDPGTFDPDRWLRPGAGELERKFLVPFGRGSRACVGRAIAMEELVVAIGNLFARVEMGVWGTGDEDMRVAHDFFSGGGKGGREGGLKVRLG
ncbi:MAG: hypothetical protein LQ343_006820 [Gyalolechia ehrenbergii]|nr:MAG: hypothetical protein LQ343_006820 [Gyalolechia ehrenbergii]